MENVSNLVQADNASSYPVDQANSHTGAMENVSNLVQAENSSPFPDIQANTHTITMEMNVGEVVMKCVQFCRENHITDPIEILKIYQKGIVTGRKLDIECETSTLEGETNLISINRNDLLRSAFSEQSYFTDLRPCLEVQYSLERAIDYGGPRKEFFASLLREISEKYFPVKHWLLDYYETVGKFMALSTLQNGKLPRIMDPGLLEEVFSDNPDPRPVVKELRKGLDTLGIYQLTSNLPSFIHLFTPQTTPLSVRFVIKILLPNFSEQGSNRQLKESSIYQLFVKYLREVGSGRRGGITLEKVLKFVTGAEEEPALGFAIQPTISFVEAVSFLPTANTCICRLSLTIPTDPVNLPKEDFLFEMYDFGFANSYFGLD